MEPHPNSAQAYLRDQHNIKYLTRQLRSVCVLLYKSTWLGDSLFNRVGIVTSVFRDRFTQYWRNKNSEQLQRDRGMTQYWNYAALVSSPISVVGEITRALTHQLSSLKKIF